MAPERRPLPKLVYGIAVAQLVSWATLYYSFAVIIVPMEATLGWPRSTITGAFTLGLVAAGLAAPWVGRALDRYGGFWLMTGGSILGALALLGWSAVDSVLAFYGVWLVLGVAMACTLYEAGFAVATAASGPDYRRAITAVTLIAGFAGTLSFPLTQALVTAVGWRGALVALALLNLAVPAALHAWLLRRVGPARDLARASATDARKALHRARRSPAYWGLLASVVGHMLMFAGVTFHVVALLGERGFAAGTVVAAWAVVGPAQVAARLGLFAVGARLGPLPSGVIAFGLAVVALALLQESAPDRLPPVLAAACFGIANGLITIVRATTVPALLGRDGYASIAGTIALPALLATAAGPSVTSLLWAHGGYDFALLVLTVVAVASLAAFVGGVVWQRRRERSVSAPSPPAPFA